MKTYTDEVMTDDEVELIELGSVSEETRGNFGPLDEGGEVPFTRQII